MAGLGVVHTIGAAAALRGGGGKGKRTKGSNYYWNDVAFRQSMKPK